MSEQASRPVGESPSSRRWSPWRIARALTIVAVVTVSTWLLAERFVLTPLPAALVGSWRVTDGPEKGATFTFHRSGAMEGRFRQGGKDGLVEATVRVSGDRLHSTTRHPQTGRRETRVLRIRALTESELTLEPENGSTLRMSRVE